MIPRDPATRREWARYMAANRLANRAYAALTAPQPTHRPCTVCGTPTRARDQRCNDCSRKP